MDLNHPLSVHEIAELIGAKPLGNTDLEVRGLNEIHKVRKGDLSFVDFEKYYNRALNSEASVVLINKEVAIPDGKAIIVSDDPFRDYNMLVKKFRPFQQSTKYVSETAEIGEGTVLQPGVFVGNNVRIGKNCLIHANVSIGDHNIIGDNVVIHSNTVLGGDAFYFKKRQQPEVFYDKLISCGRVIVEDNVEIGAGCTIDRGVSGDTIIGKGTKLDNQVHVGHGTIIGKNCLIAAQVGIAGKVNIEDNVILWGQVGVSKDLTIGEGAIILAQSGVAKSIDGGKSYFGSPVDEAKRKWRELAILKKLPDVWERLEKLLSK